MRPSVLFNYAVRKQVADVVRALGDTGRARGRQRREKQRECSPFIEERLFLLYEIDHHS